MINYFLLSDLFLFFSVGFVYDTFVLRQSFKKHINDEKILYILMQWIPGNVPLYLLMYRAYDGTFGKLYTSFYEYNPLYILPFSMLYLLLLDTHFYWAHRFQHHNYVYNVSHHHHHKHRPLNIFQARVLDAFDNIVENTFVITPLFIVPMYVPIFYFINLCNIVWGFYLHSNTGHKMPYWFLNDSNKHNIHHKYGVNNYNYSFYFSFWDKICGTYKDIARPIRLDMKENGRKLL